MSPVRTGWIRKIFAVTVVAPLFLVSCRPGQPGVIASAAETPGEPRPTVTSTETEMPTRETALPAGETATVPEPAPALPELPFDTFIEDSFGQLMRNDPEWATAEGLADVVGADETLLTDLSPEGMLKTQDLQRNLLDQLRLYPRLSLSRQQQLTYDAFEWYLDDLVRGQQFVDYGYPINQLPILSVNYLTEYLFSDQHIITDGEDAQAYLARLGQVGEKLDYVLASLEQREAQGLITPRRVIEASLGDIQLMANSTPEQTLYYTALMEHLALLSSIPPETQQALLKTAEQEIGATVIPAYQRLATFLTEQRKRAPLVDGLWQYPQGEAYYRYLLRHHTTTDLTPDEIHQMGLDELTRLQAEMRQRFDQLGYPEQASINDLYTRVSNESGIVASWMVKQTYEEIIAQAEERLDEAFDLKPAAELEVREFPAGQAFYTAAPLDGSRPGIFYVPVEEDQLRFKLDTLAYHEAFPGHHFQVALAREQDLPLFRDVVVFGPYTEGWGMYAEHLAGDLDWYADDPYGDLGRLQSEAFRAARLVVDTGLHAKGWTYDQAVDFLVANTGLPYQQMAYEVTRYIAWPGQAASYGVGLLKLLELRQEAQERLGERFDLKAFHRLVLETGSVPLEVLKKALDEQITMASLEPVSGNGDIPFYSMHYIGDYGFQEYLQSRLITQGSTQSLAMTGALEWGCTTFTGITPQGEVLLARNFDWYRHPALLLFTDPPGGYASASMVDISYLGFDGPIQAGESLEPLLRAPYLPFDGFNERGLGVGMMAVPHGEGGSDPGKATLDSLEIIRLLLDNAASVDEALDLFDDYNLDWGGGPTLHYLIADASGASVVVELVDGDLVVTHSPDPWQVSTNFLFAETPPEQRAEVCWRFATAQAFLENVDGMLTMRDSMSLLEQVSQEGATATIWSVVYNLASGEILASVGRDYHAIYPFSLSGDS
jgi:uncharacterized protein (DUF885 family)